MINITMSSVTFYLLCTSENPSRCSVTTEIGLYEYQWLVILFICNQNKYIHNHDIGRRNNRLTVICNNLSTEQRRREGERREMERKHGEY